MNAQGPPVLATYLIHLVSPRNSGCLTYPSRLPCHTKLKGMGMVIHIIILWNWLSSWSQHSFRRWTKPTTASLATGTLTDMTRSRTDLVAENAMLRQQLIILRRQVKRPKLTNGDRVRLVLLARITRYWRYTLHIVQPDTLLRWHRDPIRLYWRHKSRKRKRKRASLEKPLTSSEVWQTRIASGVRNAFARTVQVGYQS